MSFISIEDIKVVIVDSIQLNCQCLGRFGEVSWTLQWFTQCPVQQLTQYVNIYISHISWAPPQFSHVPPGIQVPPAGSWCFDGQESEINEENKHKNQSKMFSVLFKNYKQSPK